MSVRTKVGLGFNNSIRENELGWDDFAFSVFTTNSEYVEGRPIFHRFAKADSMKVVPPPLSGHYTSLSDHNDLDELQMYYVLLILLRIVIFMRNKWPIILAGKVNIPPVRPQLVPTGKPKVSAPVPTGKPKVSTPVPTGKPMVSTPVPTGRPNRPSLFPTDRGHYPSVISGWIDGQLLLSPQQVVLRNHIEKKPKIVKRVKLIVEMKLLEFNVGDHVMMNVSPWKGVVRFGKKGRPIFHRFAKADSMKVVPPPLSGHYTSLSDHNDLDELQIATHLIKDCDFHKKQMANKTISIGVGPVYNRNKVNYQNQFVPQAVLLRVSKVNIPPVRPQLVLTGKPKVSAPVPTGKPKVSTPVPTGKPMVSTPVPTGRPNRPSLFPTDRGHYPLVISGWIDGQLLLSPQQVVLGNHIEKVFTGYPRTIVDLIHLHGQTF
nr:hypothetical protein [Tanacetum cinerariifolium]